MISQSGTSKELIPVDILTDRHFIAWLEAQGISLVFSTYQSSRLMFIGVDTQGNLSGFERVFDRAMGIYATTERIYLSTRYQIWQLDNVLSDGELYQGYDKLYIPRKSHITGDIDTHDLVVEKDSNRIVFVSTKLNILATLSEKHSCIPLWKPSFISSIVGEDRCHLNGLALVDGKARYVTLCAQSDIVDGWRDHRNNGGCVIDIQSNEIITTGLSMPHSPRYYQGKLWLLNAGTGYFGYIDPSNGTFEPITFCPGFLRGLAFWGDYAIVGISKARGKDSSFKGLPLEQNLAQKDTEPRCGFLVIDLRTGSIKHWIRLEGEVEELYDIQVLPGVKRPQAIGLYSDTEISQYITLESFSPSSLSHSDNSLQTITKTNQERLKSIDKQNSTIQSNPNSQIEQLYQQAYKLQNELKIDESISLYHQILTQNSQYAPAWYQLGVIADNLGNKNEAIIAYKKALEIDPNYAQAYNNLGIIYIGNKEIEQAIIYFQQAITSKPDHAFAHNNLGLAYQMKERYIEAANRFKQALSINPEYTEAYHNLANALKFQKQYNQAIVNLETALKLNPNHIKSYLALAECYEQINQEDKAVEITKFGLLKDPTNLDLNLSLIFQLNNNLGNTQQAKQALENAIINIPNSLELQFERARLFPIIFQDSQEILDYRSQFNQVLDDFSKNLSLDNEQKRKAYEKVIALRSNFFLAYQGLDDLELQIKYGELVTRIMSANYPQWSKKITASKLKKGEKLKVGYISFYVYAHSVTQFSLGWLKYHNRDDFEIYGYHADSDEDFITEEFKKYCDVFHKIPRDLEGMAQQIAKDELHILVYLDLGMTPITMQLAGLRLAPIQCMSWGHPMTSGLPTVDYFLSNHLMEPENAQQYYREKLVRLPGLGMVPNKANLVLETVLNRSDFNLPDNKLIYLCSQSLWKYLPQYDYIWPEIAQKVDNSLFVFFRHMSKGITLKFQERIAKAFTQYGLDWQQYCYFSDRLDYHKFLRINELSDVFLDSFVWSGGISSIHAIASSLPVVTCPGEFMRGRQAMALLKKLKIEQTIAKDPAEYIDIAVDLALNKQFRQQIKEQIKNNEHLIYEDRSITQGLTKAYQTMWDAYIKNKPTETINL